MADAKEKKTERQRRPTAIKRDLQSEKARVAHRSFKAKVSTAIRLFQESAEKKDLSAKEKLASVYSLVDKGVKTGIYKANKAGRTKSRLAHKLSA